MQTARLLCRVWEVECSCLTQPVSVQEVGFVQCLALLKEQLFALWLGSCVCNFAGSTTQKVNKRVLTISLKWEERLKEMVGKRMVTVDTETAAKYIKDCCKEMACNLTGSKENSGLKMHQGRWGAGVRKKYKITQDTVHWEKIPQGLGAGAMSASNFKTG